MEWTPPQHLTSSSVPSVASETERERAKSISNSYVISVMAVDGTPEECFFDIILINIGYARFTHYFTSLMHTLLFRRSIPMQHAVAEKSPKISPTLHHRNERCFTAAPAAQAANTNLLHTIGSDYFVVR